MAKLVDVLDDDESWKKDFHCMVNDCEQSGRTVTPLAPAFNEDFLDGLLASAETSSGDVQATSGVDTYRHADGKHGVDSILQLLKLGNHVYEPMRKNKEGKTDDVRHKEHVLISSAPISHQADATHYPNTVPLADALNNDFEVSEKDNSVSRDNTLLSEPFNIEDITFPEELNHLYDKRFSCLSVCSMSDFPNASQSNDPRNPSFLDCRSKDAEFIVNPHESPDMNGGSFHGSPAKQRRSFSGFNGTFYDEKSFQERQELLLDSVISAVDFALPSKLEYNPTRSNKTKNVHDDAETRNPREYMHPPNQILQDIRIQEPDLIHAMGELLQGLREKRHYDHPEKESENDIRSSSGGLFGERQPYSGSPEPTDKFSSSSLDISPSPLSPEIEQRLAQERFTHTSDSVSAHIQHSPVSNGPAYFHRISRDEFAQGTFPATAVNSPSKTDIRKMSDGKEKPVEDFKALVDMDSSHENPTIITDNSPLRPGTKKIRKRKEKPAEENVTLVGMGFFSELQAKGLYDEVKGTTGKKKRKIRRRRKPKPDLLEHVSMGFFSGQCENKNKKARTDQMGIAASEALEKTSISDRLAPLYRWAPAVDEQTRSCLEYSLPMIVVCVAILEKFSSFGFLYCALMPVVHTLETALTDFGPKASNLHLEYAPLTPMMHLCIDILLLQPILFSMVFWPHLFGSHAYVHAAVLTFLIYIYWAIAYKDVVTRRQQYSK